MQVSEANCTETGMKDALQGRSWKKLGAHNSISGHSEDEVSNCMEHIVREGPVWDISWALQPCPLKSGLWQHTLFTLASPGIREIKIIRWGGKLQSKEKKTNQNPLKHYRG